MLIVMRADAAAEQVRAVCLVIEDLGFEAMPMPGGQRTAIGLVGNDRGVSDSRLRGMPGVQQVIHVSAPFKQVSRE